MAKIEKAIEIQSAKIQFVSLVDKAANGRQFLITKATEGLAQFTSLGKILKLDADIHYLTGIVYEPLVEDTQGNFMTAAEIQKAAYWFVKNSDKVDIQHSFESADGLAVVESYIAPSDITVGETLVAKGTWLMTVEVENDEVWEKIQKGEITGFSMGGVGSYSEVDVDLDDIAKGEVTDSFTESCRDNNFWTAWYALETCLRRYDYDTGSYVYETDEDKAREALDDFSRIITDLLAGSNIFKSLAASMPQRTSLEDINKSIGSLVNKLASKEGDENMPNETNTGPVTLEAVQKMITEATLSAVQKDATLKPETSVTFSDEQVSAIENVVAKALEPIAQALVPVLKTRGLSNSLDADGDITKSDDTHYMTGLL